MTFLYKEDFNRIFNQEKYHPKEIKVIYLITRVPNQEYRTSIYKTAQGAKKSKQRFLTSVSIEYDKYEFFIDIEKMEIGVIYESGNEFIYNDATNGRELMKAFYKIMDDWLNGDNAEDDEFNEKET